MMRDWLKRRFGGRDIRSARAAQRRLRGVHCRRAAFESLESRLLLAQLTVSDTSLTFSVAAGESCLVGGASLDGSEENPLNFGNSGAAAITLSGDAATYFELSGTNNSIATLKSDQTLDARTTFTVTNADAGSGDHFTFGDGTNTLPDLGATLRVNNVLTDVTLASSVSTTGFNQTYDCPTFVDGDVTLTGAAITFSSTLDGNDATPSDKLTINASDAVTFSGTIGQTYALNCLSVTNDSGALSMGTTTLDGDDAELRLDLVSSFSQTGVFSGSMGFTLVAGSATLDQTNTFTGDVSVEGGTLTLSQGASSVRTGNLLVGDGTGVANSAIATFLRPATSLPARPR
jgi:autotransporter-associated beta strand protein